MDLFDRLSLALPRLRLLREEPLAAHTSFRIGGPAEVMAFPSSLAELQALLRLSAQEGIRVRLLGAGTNILAPDGGVRGLVIVTSGALTGLSMPDAAHIEAMSGVTMARLACFARDNGLTGLEFAHGIPGTVGGGVYMNAGAYGGRYAPCAAGRRRCCRTERSSGGRASRRALATARASSSIQTA